MRRLVHSSPYVVGQECDVSSDSIDGHELRCAIDLPDNPLLDQVVEMNGRVP